MKTIKLYIFLIFIFLHISACKKNFLDVPDKQTVLRQAYIKDLSSTSDFLNGIYTELASKFYSAPHITYPEIISDNIKPISNGSSLLVHYNWTQKASEEVVASINLRGSNANGLWLSGYRIARDCNFIIESIDQYRSENPAKADDMKGQAFAIRALILHQLVNVFAQPYSYSADGGHPGIPYVKTSLFTEKVSRQTVAVVYENLIADLKQGIELMAEKPLNVKDLNRQEVMNKDAARALLARVYLYKADFKNANLISTELTSRYSLMSGGSYPTKLFTAEDTESFLRLTPAHFSLGYSTFFSGGYYRSFKQYLATSDIGNSLTTTLTDLRSSWVLKNILPSGELSYDIRKFPVSATPSALFADANYYQTVIRTSEIFLTAAESYFNLNDEPNARLYLDKVRMRADPNANPTTSSGTVLRELIYQERNKELCFEGQRMFDLLRWKKGVHRSDPLASSPTDLPYPSLKAVAPLPLSDIQQLGMPQNESY